jgi:hypothetical protein
VVAEHGNGLLEIDSLSAEVRQVIGYPLVEDEGRFFGRSNEIANRFM